MVEILIKTTKPKEVVDITDRVAKEISALSVEEGICSLFLTHTTAALTTADLDPGGTDLDYLDAFEKLVPKYSPSGVEGIPYRHPHNPAHMPDHILSSLIGTSLSLPVKDGKLILGTWQRVVLVEFDGPRERTLTLTLATS